MEGHMETVELTPELFLGKGWHKATYIDPRDATRCVKIVHHEHEIGKDSDLAREMWYRRSREMRHLKSQLLTEYYGTVETNLGTGYVFERVVDFDGKNSIDFKDFFAEQQENPHREQAKQLVTKVLSTFKEAFFREKIITSNMQYENFVIQQDAPDYQSFRIRIIDNIGSPVLIPLAFFIDYFAKKHCQRYWRKFIDDLANAYPDLVLPDA